MSRGSTDVDLVAVLGQADAVHCGFHLLPYLAQTVVRQLASSAYVVVTDLSLAKSHLEPLLDALRSAIADAGSSARVLSYAVPPGETSKSRKTKAEVEDYILSERCTRDTVLLALGGGVVGDLTGFVAATFMRGVRVVQIPTTLLAMVDSAVGGKTAIDVPLGKNLIGAFHQPSLIFIDAAYLETLPEREFINGLAECIKTAAIWDEAEFEKLENGVEAIRAAQSGSTTSTHQGRTRSTRTAEQDLLLSVIVASISTKAHIVTEDPLERGLRNLVNFGHTVGHALEAVLTPAILHGECVAIGMVLEAEISRALGHLSNAAVARVQRCLAAHGLPTTVADPRIQRAPGAAALTVERLLDVMRVDKKNAGAAKKVVLLSRIGATLEQRATAVDDAVIAMVLSPSVLVRPAANAATTPRTITPPGSKSISNRALVLAALGSGTCRLKGLLHSDDTRYMMAALSDMNGATFAYEDGGETLVVQGGGGKLSRPTDGKALYLGNAGTAARFLTTVCTLIQPSADGAAKPTFVTGNARMKQRPIQPLLTALTANGAQLDSVEQSGFLPLAIMPTGLRGGKVELAASLSSQYVSSILLAAPYAKEPVELHLVGDAVISQPYIDMTVAMMRSFGVEVERVGERVYRVPRAVYRNPAEYVVEADASSATYPLALAAVTGSTVVVERVGSASLQGDAQFARLILEPMGCTVEQTATSTKVTGPAVGQLRAPPGDTDMETMTDASLTAACIAAVATGTTRIVGIANQRVKECDRIAALVAQLARLGVHASELPTGIEVVGVRPEQLTAEARIHCYDDHRIAMAFSVLAAATGGPGAIIDERRCVEKTWPSWWVDAATLGVALAPADAPRDSGPHASTSTVKAHQAGADPAWPPGKYAEDASILLVGMRGSGKTFTGTIAAFTLGRTLVDADVYFEQRTGLNPRDYVHRHGWPAFRVDELKYLRELLDECATGHVIPLGGGVVETVQAHDLLREYAETRGPVINVMRDIDEIIEYLDTETGRPSLGAPIPEIAARRAPLFKQCSTFDFISHTGFKAVKAGETNGHAEPTERIQSVSQMIGNKESIRRTFRFITGTAHNHVDLTRADRPTYFLALTFPDLTPVLDLVDDFTVGVDAIELRVDLLSPDGRQPTSAQIPPLEYVGQQLAALRQRTSLPIIFTVRTVAQGGKFPDSAEHAYFEFVHQALRWACEYVDLEGQWSDELLEGVVAAKGSSLLICSAHDWTGDMRWDGPGAHKVYDRLDRFGDIVKIVGTASSVQDNYDLLAFRDRIAKAGKTKPLLTINMGVQGQLSRVLNPVLSPVTHPLMPGRAAPGQLTFAEIQSAMHLIGQSPRRKFCLFGTPIAHSKSPLLHNTGFQLLGLPHEYGRHETPTVDQSVVDFIRSPDFGGASVTIPHKLEIIPHLDDVTPEVKLIGACNTVIPRRAADGTIRLLGANTDAPAMQALLEMHLRPDHEFDRTRSVGLVIGAGGTSRAAVWTLHAFGVKTIYLYNRTLANAVKVANVFPSSYDVRPITSLDPTQFDEPPIAILSTIPGEGTATPLHSNPDAGVFLPESIFARPQGGIAMDLAYKPKRTPMLALAESIQPEGRWTTVAGITVLIEQGYRQFELWTDRRAPRKEIAATVMASYNAS